MKVLGVIPARADSKRFPRKSLANLCGMPMIAWTIRAARESRVLDRLLVSTDDWEIDAVAQRMGVEVLVRPHLLALDSTASQAVVEHIRAACEFDVLAWLQPTSPLRTAADIGAAFEILRKSGGDAVVSVTEAGDEDVFEVGFAQRLRPLRAVKPNGAIYLITRDALERGETFYSGTTYAYRMPKARSLDVDHPFDLEQVKVELAKELAA